MFSWQVMTYVLAVLFIVTHVVFTAWVFVGGWFDLLHMFRVLSEEQVNPSDDGRVHPSSDAESG